MSLAACSGSPTSPDRDQNSGGLTQAPTGNTTPVSGPTPEVGSFSKPITLPVITSMPTADDFMAGQILVRFNAGTPQATVDSLHARLGGTLDSLIYGSDVQIVTVPTGQELAIIDAYNREPSVDYAEPDHKYAALFTPNDTSFASKQWDMTKIKCQQAWDVTKGLATVKVAVLDTGIDRALMATSPRRSYWARTSRPPAPPSRMATATEPTVRGLSPPPPTTRRASRASGSTRA